MHGYRENKELFSVAMAVMAFCEEKSAVDNSFDERTKDWCRDIEYTGLAYAVYKGLEDKNYNENAIKAYTNDLLETSEKYPLPEDPNAESDCWLGITCGEYLGYPTEEKLQVVEKALQEFADDEELGYLSEVFECHPEWRGSAFEQELAEFDI